MTFKITLSWRFLILALLTIISINLIFLQGTWLANSSFFQAHSYLNHIVFQFDLGSENNLAAWYSSMLLFLSALMSMICFMIDRKPYDQTFNQYINAGWLMFAAIFAVLSFDELGSVHENIGDSLLFKDAGKVVMGNHDSGWIIFMALVGLVSVFMIIFGILRLRLNKWAVFFLFTGLLLYLSNPIQENYEMESYHAAADPATWKRPVFFLLLEEGTEILGSLCFLVALTLYSIKLPGTKTQGFQIEFKSSVILRFAKIVIITAFLGLVLTEFILGDVVPKAQTGVPKNWFTAIIAFTVSVYSINWFKNMSLHNSHFKIILFSAGMISMAFSAYYGSNLYAYPITPLSSAAFHKEIINIFLSIASLLPAVLLFISCKNIWIRTGTLLWCIICFAIFSNPIYSSETAFIAFCCLFYTLTFYPTLSNRLDAVHTDN